MFDNETEAAQKLAQMRIVLLPQLAHQFREFIPAEFSGSLAALPSYLSDMRCHPAGPLIWYFVHRVFLCAAQHSPNLREAAAALKEAYALGESLDTTSALHADAAGIVVLWTLPPLPLGLSGVPVGLSSNSDRARFLENVRGGLELIRETCAGLADKLSSQLCWIVPMPEERDGRHSMSLANLPGTIFVGARSSPDLMAELIVHEYLHTVLHAAGEVTPLIEAKANGDDFYSPWREDARPAEGLLHGIYVFTGVMLFWLSHLQDPGLRGAYAQERAATIRLQLQSACRTIAERFSGSIADRIVDSAYRSISLAQSAPVWREAAIEAEHRVDRHYRQWLMRH